jgi:hypothetical protein
MLEKNANPSTGVFGEGPADSGFRKFPELLLDNMVHQVSLLVVDDGVRKRLVNTFRAVFAEVYLVAQMQARWISRESCAFREGKTLMHEFATTGHVQAASVSDEVLVEVARYCEEQAQAELEKLEAEARFSRVGALAKKEEIKVVQSVLYMCRSSQKGESLVAIEVLRRCTDYVQGACHALQGGLDLGVYLEGFQRGDISAGGRVGSKILQEQGSGDASVNSGRRERRKKQKRNPLVELPVNTQMHGVVVEEIVVEEIEPKPQNAVLVFDCTDDF